MTVTFTDVGRGKMCWTAETDSVDAAWLYKQVKKHGALGSRGIDFDMLDDRRGAIYVGGFREVGQFELSEPLTASAGAGGEG